MRHIEFLDAEIAALERLIAHQALALPASIGGMKRGSSSRATVEQA
jgi:hypothetical protein